MRVIPRMLVIDYDAAGSPNCGGAMTRRQRQGHGRTQGEAGRIRDLLPHHQGRLRTATVPGSDVNPELPPRPPDERLRRVIAWFMIARGCLALFLGVALLLQREGTSETLATFMGLYWLSGGILALTFHREIRTIGVRRLPIVAGIFGVVAGSAILIRGVVLQATPSAEETFLLVGILILMTGLANLGSGVPTSDDPARRRGPESVALGTLEVILGAALILSRGVPATFLLLATTTWALAAGTVLVAQGTRFLRRSAAAGGRP
jgi:uncharacterized membrane protein HdeD (DUF308 family)